LTIYLNYDKFLSWLIWHTQKRGESMPNEPNIPPMLFIYYDDRIAEIMQINELRKAGLEIVITNDHEFARQLLNNPQHPFGIVIAETLQPPRDLSLHECDDGFGTGLAILERIRAKPHNQGLRLFLCSATPMLMPKTIHNYKARCAKAQVKKVFPIRYEMWKNILLYLRLAA